MTDGFILFLLLREVLLVLLLHYSEQDLAQTDSYMVYIILIFWAFYPVSCSTLDQFLCDSRIHICNSCV